MVIVATIGAISTIAVLAIVNVIDIIIIRFCTKTSCSRLCCVCIVIFHNLVMKLKLIGKTFFIMIFLII